MESVDGNGGSRLVVTELSHIKELVRQLEVHLGGSPDLCKNLASQISCLTDRSIGMITSSDSLHGGLASATPSPLSDVVVSDVPFKQATKKRRMMEKRKLQVRVSSAGGGDNPVVVDDGHSWRKYGQKEILGAKHPRGYYRCTHRHSQGCAATKQVQRTDEDPTLFDVVYHGTHTCVHKAAAVAAPERNPEAHSLLQSLSASLRVETEGLGVAAEPQGWGASTPFCFSSTPAERGPFSAAAAASPETWAVSPATSDSNHAASSFPLFDAAAAWDAEWKAPQSELQEVVSALVAASTPAPAVDVVGELLDFDISCFFA